MASIADTAGAPALPTLDQLIANWHGAKAALADAQAHERAARDALFVAAFPNKPDKGTHRRGIGWGKELKLTAKLNHSVDRDALALAKPQLDALDPELFANLIRYRPEVSETGLARAQQLGPKAMAVVSTFVTSRPGTPGLEIVDAKQRG